MSNSCSCSTHGDRDRRTTRPRSCRNWPAPVCGTSGSSDVGADASRQRKLTSLAHDAGFEVMLEVVSTSKEDELSSLHAAAAAGVDWVLGGTARRDGAGILPDGVRYCPFLGKVVDHPERSARHASTRSPADAERLTALDHVSGLDLLAYRHPTADHEAADPCGGCGARAAR